MTIGNVEMPDFFVVEADQSKLTHSPHRMATRGTGRGTGRGRGRGKPIAHVILNQLLPWCRMSWSVAHTLSQPHPIHTIIGV